MTTTSRKAKITPEAHRGVTREGPERRWRSPRSIAVAAAIIAGLVIVAAVAIVGFHSGHAADAGGLPKPGATDPLVPSGGAAFPGAGPATLLTPAQATGLTSLPWELVGMNARRTRLEIYYVAGGGCTSPRGLFVQQSPDIVLIAALGKTVHPVGTACPGDLKVGRASVTLRAPLGTRPLVHAVVDDAWNDARYLGP